MSTRQTVTIQGPDDRQKIATWARNVEAGTVVTFRKKSRSSEQSAKMWAMLGEVSDQVEWYGQKLDAEDWKDVFTASLRHARVVPGIDKGTYVPLGMHTSTLTIEEMSNLIELIYAFGAEHNVVFKEPQTTESGSPQPDTADAPPPASGTEEAGNPDPVSSPLTPHGWLLAVSKMLWAATNYGGDIDVLKAQKVAAMSSFEVPTAEGYAAKANGVYGYCKQVVLKEMTKADGLAMVAGVVGADQHEIGGL